MMSQTAKRAFPQQGVFGFAVPLGMTLFLVAATLAGDPFWEKKDWEGWSETQCDQILADPYVGSPWAQSTSTGYEGVRGAEYTHWINVQFRSARPVALALARLEQIQNKYGKMTPQERQEFDKKTQLALAQDFTDEVLVHIKLGIDEQGPRGSAPATPPAISAVFIAPSGQRINSSPPGSVVTRPNGGLIEYDVRFPRIVDGQPLLAANDKKFSIECSGFSLDFTVSKMTFHGKLEY